MKVVSVYRFVQIDAADKLRGRLQVECEKERLLGTVLLAEEGVNGTLAGEGESIRRVLEWLSAALSVAEPIDGRWTSANEAPFQCLRIKVKKEIVTLGRPDLRPDRITARHVGVDEWHELLADSATLVIDTRNEYEHELGTFDNALNPATDSFREFGEFAASLSESDKQRPVAMFCTGGIRCEKASALMIELGFDNVRQLNGGILGYLEEVDDAANLWRGECFVFDKRVAVDRDRAEGGYVQCHACRRPLSSEDLSSPDYREGVSCPKCIATIDAARRESLEERRKQVRLARERGERHSGAC